MMAVTCVEIANFIAKNCIVSIIKNELLIICQSEDQCRFLIKQRHKILNSLSQENLNISQIGVLSQIDWVTIAVNDAIGKTSFPIKSKTKMEAKIIVPKTEPLIDLIGECLSYHGSCGIVRMDDHKGLFSNERIMFSSAANPNDWIGKKMSDFWYQDELDIYMSRLIKDGELRNYSYKAKLMDGRPVHLTVDARLILWHGEPARIVKTISRELLV